MQEYRVVIYNQVGELEHSEIAQDYMCETLAIAESLQILGDNGVRSLFDLIGQQIITDLSVGINPMQAFYNLQFTFDDLKRQHKRKFRGKYPHDCLHGGECNIHRRLYE